MLDDTTNDDARIALDQSAIKADALKLTTATTADEFAARFADPWTRHGIGDRPYLEEIGRQLYGVLNARGRPMRRVGPWLKSRGGKMQRALRPILRRLAKDVGKRPEAGPLHRGLCALDHALQVSEQGWGNPVDFDRLRLGTAWGVVVEAARLQREHGAPFNLDACIDVAAEALRGFASATDIRRAVDDHTDDDPSRLADIVRELPLRAVAEPGR